MSNEEALFLVLCVIHATDCLLWVGNYSVVFVTWSGKFWRETSPGLAFRTSRGGPLFLNPFPPFGRGIYCHLPPLSLSPAGVCSLNCQILTHSHSLYPMENVVAIPFEEIRVVKASGRRISVNDSEFCLCNNERQAQRLGGQIRSLLETNAEEREALIRRFWAGQFDYETAGALLESARGRLTYLEVLSSILFVCLFVLAPLLALRFGLDRMIVPVAVALLIPAVPISVGFFIIHRKTYPADTEDRIVNLIKMIFCPPTCLHAGSLISENLLSGFNPLVAGHLLLSRDQFRAFSARILRNFIYPPIRNSVDATGCEICNWQNQLLSEMVSDYLRDKANLQEDLLAPPSPSDPDVQAYCPRCLSQFTRKEGDCPDCTGIGLLRFERRAPIPARGE